MTLRGPRDGLFQGCDGHGYWLDADAIPHTGLAAGVDEARLDRKRGDRARMAAEAEARQAAEQERAQRKHDQDRREANVAEVIAKGGLEGSGPTTDLRQLLEDHLDPVASLRRRLDALEARNDELERRIAALEHRQPRGR
jgi:hypothetical protein